MYPLYSNLPQINGEFINYKEKIITNLNIDKHKVTECVVKPCQSHFFNSSVSTATFG